LGDPGVDGRMDIQDVGCGGTYLIELTEDRGSLRALVSAVMNFRVL